MRVDQREGDLRRGGRWLLVVNIAAERERLPQSCDCDGGELNELGWGIMLMEGGGRGY